jgi:hypothetical protein
MYDDTKHPWTALLPEDRHYGRDPLPDFLHNLIWLGLPDFHNPATQYALDIIQKVIPQCTTLRTLCLRQKKIKRELTNHDYTSKLLGTIATFMPQSVTILELRTPPLAMDELVNVLNSCGSSVKRIGIDFGAWAQQYPKQTMPDDELNEEDIKAVARKAARKERFEAYEEVHKETFQADDRWLLPESYVDERITRQKGSVVGSPKHAFERNFYRVNEIFNVVPKSTQKNLNDEPNDTPAKQDHHAEIPCTEHAKVDMLPDLLNNLYGLEKAHPNIKLFALIPEWQERSTDPINPLALLQQPEIAGKSPSFTTVQPGVYSWIHRTFDWHPIFDWDAFIRLEYRNGEGRLSTSYREIRKRLGLDASHSRYDDLLTVIAQHFKHLKNAGIPIHLFIGCRHPDISSLYWGWPYDETAWSQWLETPFDASLRSVAPIIDILTVMYDIRNPLNEDRLRAIEELSPQNGNVMLTTCPRPLCPWADYQQCPFQRPWYHSESKNQKMANKYNLKTPESVPALAPNLPFFPPTGQYAQASRDVSLLEDSLHDLATLAAFQREAVGWHRFWSTYSSQLTDLSQLHIRMPSCFDGMRSVSLARKLLHSKGWRVVAYANESADIQTVRDVEDGEVKRWPAGTFVRRSWFWQKDVAEQKPVGDDGENLENREKEELKKAVKRAAEASKLEREREMELKNKLSEDEGRERTMTTDDLDIDRKLVGVYGRKMRLVARHTWRKQMQAYIDDLGYRIEDLEYDGVAEEDEETVRVLRQTQPRLENRLKQYRLSKIWQKDGSRRNGLSLVVDTRDYDAEETKNRNRSMKMEKMSKPEVTQTPVETDTWTPYDPSSSPVWHDPEESGAGTTAQADERNTQDSVGAQVQDLLDVLQTHGPQIYNEPDDVSAQVEHLLGELRTHATPGIAEQVTQIQQTIEIEETRDQGAEVERFEQSTEVEVIAKIDVEEHGQFEQLAVSRQSAPSPASAKSPPPQAIPPKESSPSKEFTPAKEPPLPKDSSLLKEPTSSKKPAPTKKPSSKKDPTRPKEYPPPKEPKPQKKPAPPKKKPLTRPSPQTKPATPGEPSIPKQPIPSPAPAPALTPVPSPPPTKKRATSKRKDPVIVDDVPDLTSGRKLRSSRSATPAKSYKEDTDDEDMLEKKGKGRRKKRLADEEWDEKVASKKRGRKKGGE